MKNMWLWKNKKEVTLINPIYRTPERCAICGQYFRNGEKAALIMCPEQFADLRVNRKLVHQEEWNAFCADINSDLDLAEKLLSHRQPRARSLSADDVSRIAAFEQAAREFGFIRVTTKPYGRKCQKPKTSISVEYNVYNDNININNRAKEGLFDGFYKREIVAKIFNRMHEILGDGRKDDYQASNSINQVFNEVKGMVDID